MRRVFKTLIPCVRDVEKLTVVEVVKIFSAFYSFMSFTIAFRTSSHWTLIQTRLPL